MAFLVVLDSVTLAACRQLATSARRRLRTSRAPATPAAEQVARFFATQAGAVPDAAIVECTVNGQPGLVVQSGGGTVSVLAVEIAGDRIRHVWAACDPAPRPCGR